MTKKLSAQVHEIIRKNERLMTMVAQESTQRLIHATQVPKAKGGKMPIDTGFLRASGRLSLSGVPSGPVRGRDRKEGEEGTIYPSPDSVQIGGFKIGMTMFWGWTAVYARRQELYNGFLSSNIRQWQKIVDGVVRDLRNRIK